MSSPEHDTLPDPPLSQRQSAATRPSWHKRIYTNARVVPLHIRDARTPHSSGENDWKSDSDVRVQEVPSDDTNKPEKRRVLASTLAQYSRHLRAAPNIAAALIWISMLSYFAAWYTTQPREPTPYGPKLPRPCHRFSLWPYISCAGQHKRHAFRGVCIAMALLNSCSFLEFARLTAPMRTGRAWRLASTAFAFASNAGLVAMSFVAIDEFPTAHLGTASVQIFGMFACKFCDWGWNRAVRRAWGKRMGKRRRVRALEVSRWCKIAVTAFSLGPAIFTGIGMYGCQDGRDVADLTSTCNRMVALSEIAEWNLSLGWVTYMCCVAFDLYHVDDIVRVWVSAGIDDDLNRDGKEDMESIEDIAVQDLVPRRVDGEGEKQGEHFGYEAGAWRRNKMASERTTSIEG